MPLSSGAATSSARPFTSSKTRTASPEIAIELRVASTCMPEPQRLLTAATSLPHPTTLAIGLPFASVSRTVPSTPAKSQPEFWATRAAEKNGGVLVLSAGVSVPVKKLRAELKNARGAAASALSGHGSSLYVHAAENCGDVVPLHCTPG